MITHHYYIALCRRRDKKTPDPVLVPQGERQEKDIILAHVTYTTHDMPDYELDRHLNDVGFYDILEEWKGI